MKTFEAKRVEYHAALSTLNKECKREIEAVTAKFAAQFQSIESKLQILEQAETLLNEGDAASISDNPTETEVPQVTIFDEDKRPFERKWRFSIGDAIERAMGEAETPLSISEIMEAIEKMDVRPSRKTVRSLLAKARNRFCRVAEGVYYRTASPLPEDWLREEKAKLLNLGSGF